MIAAAPFLAWSMAYAATSLVACVRARRFFAPLPPRPFPSREAVVVVRPCHGHEPLLRANLETTAGACRRGDAVVFAIERAEDGAATDAWHVAHALVQRGVDARVVVTGARGPNRKADQIARALAHQDTPARAIVVVADSDVALASSDIDALVAALGGAAVGAAWAPPCETADPVRFGDRAAAAVLDASLHAFPLLAGIDAHGMVGKLFAVRRSSIEWAGGFGAFVSCLGEDMELARRLRVQGERCVHIPRIARAKAQGRSLDDTVERFTRWLSVIRAQRAALLASYPLLFCALPLFALAALLVRDAWMALVLAGCTRLAVAMVGRAIAERRFSPLAAMADVVIGELVLFAAFTRALVTREVRWRDHTLRLGPHGALVEEEP